MFTRAWVVLAVLLLALVSGCQSVRQGAEGTPAAAGGPPAGAAEGPPVVYETHAASKPLSAEQREGILTVAKEHCPKGRSIWFLYVHSNLEYDGMPWYWISVYYSPDRQTTRLRRGFYIDTGSALPPIRGWDPTFGEWSATFENRPVRSRYCQVSLPAEPFTEELGAPQGLLLPFPAPEGFSDEEIIEIVDFVQSLWRRSKISYDDWSRIYSEERVTEEGDGAVTITGPWVHFGRGDSISAISRNGKVVTVSIGSRQQWFSAFYTVIRCVKTVGGYKLIDSYIVIS